jgi:flagellar assembly factor FliW
MDAIEVEFPQGMPGFPGRRRFALETLGDGPLQRLVSREPPGGPNFVVIEPALVFPDLGELELDEATVELLHVDRPEQVRILSVLTVADDRVTANLLGPVVLNVSAGLGCQVIAEGRPVRASLSDRSLACLS